MEMTCRRCGRTIEVADEESLVEEYIRRGELTREQAESHPPALDHHHRVLPVVRRAAHRA